MSFRWDQAALELRACRKLRPSIYLICTGPLRYRKPTEKLQEGVGQLPSSQPIDFCCIFLSNNSFLWLLSVFLFLATQVYSSPGIYPGQSFGASFLSHIFSSQCVYFCSPQSLSLHCFPAWSQSSLSQRRVLSWVAFNTGLYCDSVRGDKEMRSDDRKPGCALMWLGRRWDLMPPRRMFLLSVTVNSASFGRHITSAEVDCVKGQLTSFVYILMS